MSRRVQLYDTTLRDGSQGEGVTFSVQDKLLITQRLDEAGFDFIEGGFPLSNPKDAEYFQRVRDLDLKHATVCAFGLTRRKNTAAEDDVTLKALVDAGTPAVTVVGKTWDLHVNEIMRIDRAENLAMIADSVAFLKAEGKRVIYDAEHFFDGYRANPDFALETLRAAADAGAEIVVLCDTNGGSLPDFVARAVHAAREAIRCPVGIHCHNDSDLATANTLAAVQAGAIQVQGTINGIGERCGNADLIAAAANLALKLDFDVLLPAQDGAGGVQHLTELSRFVYETANLALRRGQPFVGSSAFAHKGGMHVHAVNRLASSYEHIDPAKVGNERRILVSELSGRSNIVAAATKLKIDADDALMRTVLAKVVELEHAGYQFEAAEASFELLVKKCAGTFQSHFNRDHYRVNIESGQETRVAGEEPVTEASIKLRIPMPDGSEEVRHEVAEGDGPINALDAALRKALLPVYPQLAEVTLTDYKVRVINPTEGTAAKVRVMIESHGSGPGEPADWSTVGVSENVVEASWLALCDSIEYALARTAAPEATAEESVQPPVPSPS
ncbi:citramalate synthase [Alienimonas californiensis]|uniref:Citramalate synthase n=1 Tax=Alienimonas californiensis TaxID=2527989 RepID=A0A517PFB3_9PLAN|nr:citramalate synthase [Alienimonas californiensis]QDT18066.1 2-isopropylmalate synthase [Alienimonas californiensis]